MSFETKLPEIPLPEEQLAALSSAIVGRYREIVMEGPLLAYFAVVRGGMMDAAQLITDQVEASVASFQDKITELVAESDYFKTANRSITEMQQVARDFKSVIDSIGVMAPVPEGPPPSTVKTESGTSE